MNEKIIIGNTFLKKVLPLIKNAEKTIEIIVFYWSFDYNDEKDSASKLVKELQNAIGRNVKVKILVNSEAVAERLYKCGFDVRNIYSSRLMHPKVMILDKKIAVIGSHNYTMAGFENNLEVSYIVDLETSENDLQYFFNHLWGI